MTRYHKLTALLAAVMMVLSVAAVPISVGAQDVGTVIVDDDFADENPSEDTDGDNQYATIQGAVDDAQAGELIRVREGTYDESVNVDKQVDIVAVDGPEVTAITTRGVGTSANYTVQFNADRINFTGFTVIGDTGETAVLVNRTDEEVENEVEDLQFTDNTVIASQGGIGLKAINDDMADAHIRNNLFRVWEDEDDGTDVEPDSDEMADTYVYVNAGSDNLFEGNVLTDSTERDPSAPLDEQDDTVDRVIEVDNDGDGQIDGHLDDYSEDQADENVSMGRIRDPVVANWSDRVDTYGGLVEAEADDDVEAQNLMIVGSEDATTIRDNEFLANVSDRDGDGVAARLLIQDTFTADNAPDEDGQGDTSDYTIEGNEFPTSRYALQQFADLGNDQDISTVLADNTFDEAVTAEDPDEDVTAGEDGMLPGIWADIEPAILAAEADPGADETVNVVRAGYYSNFTVRSGGLAAVDAVEGAVIDQWPDEKDPGISIVGGASDVRIEGFEIRDQEHGVVLGGGGTADVVLVADGSGSVTSDPAKFQALRDGAVNLADSLGSDARVAFVPFSDGATVAASLGDGRSTVVGEIQDTSNYPGGGTNIGNAIDTAQNHLTTAGRPGADKYMIVLTNGLSASGRTEASNAKSAGTTIFGVAYGSGADQDLIEDVSSPPKVDDGRITDADRFAFVADTSEISGVLGNLFAVDNVTLVDNDIHDNNNTGVLAESAGNVTVSGGAVYDNGEHYYNNGDIVNDTENVDDGIRATSSTGVTVDGTAVYDNENDNIDFTDVEGGLVQSATISDAGARAVPLTSPNVDPADDGVQIDEAESDTSENILVNGSNFYANPDAGVRVVSFTDGEEIPERNQIAGFVPSVAVTYNDFEGQERDVVNEDGKLVEARLNWFGDGGGNPDTVNVHPTGNHPATPMTQEANNYNSDGSVVTGTATDEVVYDPFLTNTPENVTFGPSNTQQYGHDVLMEAVDTESEGPQVVGFPGPTGQNFSQIFSRVNDSDVAPDTMIWAYDASADEWVDPATLSDQQADSLDAIAVTRLNKTVAVPIDFADDGGTPGAIQVKRVEPGFNLIASPGHLPAEDAMAVENAGGIERVQNGVLEEPESQPRTTNGIERTFVYNEDTGDNDLFDPRGPTLSPYTGYWVFAESGGDVAPRMTAGYRFQDEYRSLDYEEVLHKKLAS